MSISVGDTLPNATLYMMGEEGPESVSLQDKLKGRKVVLFALPGAYTGVCSTAHVPSFIRTKGDFDAKGVDEIICVSVNDPFVMKAWADATVQRLLHAAAAADWMPPPSLVTTLERGLRAPQSFVLKVAPPAPVRLDQVHLYASEDRWALLGVAFALSPPRIASESR